MIKKTILQYFTMTMLISFGMGSACAVYVTFLTSHGLNLLEVNLVNLVFFSTRFICEIPTGAFADVFGRKVSFVVSCILFSLGMFLYGLSNSFWGFVVSEAITAIGSTFISGAFDAWLVDMLNHHGGEDAKHNVFSKAGLIGQFACMVAALAGAYLADIRGSLPWFMGSIVFAFTAILSAFWMKEEYFQKKAFSWSLGWRSMKDTVYSSIKYGLRNKVVRFIVLSSLVGMLAFQAPNMQWQPYFISFLKEKRNLGYLWIGMSLFMMLGSILAPHLLKLVKGEKRSLIVCNIFTGLCLAVTTMIPFFPGIVVYMVHEIPRGMIGPLKKKFLHDNIPSHARATVASFESISPHLGGMIGLLASGFIANTYSISVAWLLSGIFLVVATLCVARKS